MARGFHGYLNEFIHLTDTTSILFFVLLITVIAITGVSLSFKVVAIITVIEFSGILMILFVSRDHLFAISERWHELIPPFYWEV